MNAAVQAQSRNLILGQASLPNVNEEMTGTLEKAASKASAAADLSAFGANVLAANADLRVLVDRQLELAGG